MQSQETLHLAPKSGPTGVLRTPALHLSLTGRCQGAGGAREDFGFCVVWSAKMIRKLKSGKYRLYSMKKDPKTGKRKNLGTFDTREAAQKHEREVESFKHKK